MSVSTLVVLGLAMALSLFAQPSKEDPNVKVVSVEIIVDTLDAQKKRCSAGGVDPRAVLVAGKEVFHCVEEKLLTHDDDNKDFEKTLVYVSAGQSIRWFSKTSKIRIIGVRLHAPVEKGAPPSPFVAALPKDFMAEVTSPPVRDEQPDIQQRYKVSFEIDKEGNRFDPDVVCSM